MSVLGGFQHLRARVHIGNGLEPFPARTIAKRLLDYIMYGVGICAPLALTPQIFQLYKSKSSVGLSLITWSLLTIFNALWALYGAVHKDKQLFFANALMTLFEISIVAGILIY